MSVATGKEFCISQQEENRLRANSTSIPSPVGSIASIDVSEYKTPSAGSRRGSVSGEEEYNRIKRIYAKLKELFNERAKSNPSITDPSKFLSEDYLNEISSALRAESQFAPAIGPAVVDFSPTDAVHEEMDCSIIDAIDNYGHSTFLPEDEEILLLFFREISQKIHGANGKPYSRRRGTKTLSNIQLDQALVDGYEALKAHFTASKITAEKLLPPVVHVLSPASMTSISRWSFDPFARSDEELKRFAEQMIVDYGLVEQFNIDVGKLRELITEAQKTYRPTNAFHNFYHGIGVMHLSYQILNRGAADYLTPLEILAVLVGALCHDLDHPGNNNGYEIATSSELALIYADDAVLERYHLYLTQKLLRIPKCDILSNMPLAQKLEFRALISSGILATDMSKHFAITEQLVKCSKLDPPFQILEASSRSSLVGYIIHCADIGAQTQARELALKWGSRVIEEFRLQAVNEAKNNVPLTPIMQGLDNELACMNLQQLKTCLQRAIDNRNYYEDRVYSLSSGIPGSPKFVRPTAATLQSNAEIAMSPRRQQRLSSLDMGSNPSSISSPSVKSRKTPSSNTSTGTNDSK